MLSWAMWMHVNGIKSNRQHCLTGAINDQHAGKGCFRNRLGQIISIWDLTAASKSPLCKWSQYKRNRPNQKLTSKLRCRKSVWNSNHLKLRSLIKGKENSKGNQGDLWNITDQPYSRVLYLINECDGAIDMDYAYLFALERGMTTHTQACAVLGHKFAHLREAEGGETDRQWERWEDGKKQGIREQGYTTERYGEPTVRVIS